MESRLTPALVVGGYLGAGKTTLVNHLLRFPDGKRIAVLVNDFGDLSIDADLIEGQHGNLISLAGGCVCCSFGSDLVGSLRQVMDGNPAPDLILIETSGVGLPAAVARSARLAMGLAIEGIVVLVDAETVRERIKDPYIGDTVAQQLREADLLLINKVDLIASAAIEDLRKYLAGLAPLAGQINAVNAQIPLGLLLGLRDSELAPVDWSADRPALASLTGVAARPADAQFVSVTLAPARRLDLEQLTQALVRPGSGVVRAKGIVTGLDGQRCLINLVGQRAQLRAYPIPAGPQDKDRLVIIGLRHVVNHAELESLLQ